MLIGEYQHTIDAKSRIIIPSKFREELGSRFILTKGLDGCLYVYSLAEWANVENTLRGLSTGGKDARAFVRYFFAGAVECEVDKQGRIVIPQHLRDHANIDKEVVTIGSLSKVEIWSKKEWDQYIEKNHDCEDIAEKMSELRI